MPASCRVGVPVCVPVCVALVCLLPGNKTWYCFVLLLRCVLLSCCMPHAFTFALSRRFKDYTNAAQRHFLCHKRCCHCMPRQGMPCYLQKTTKCWPSVPVPVPVPAALPLPLLHTLCSEKIDEILDRYSYSHLGASTHECSLWVLRVAAGYAHISRRMTSNSNPKSHVYFALVCVFVWRIKHTKILKSKWTIHWVSITVGRIGKTLAIFQFYQKKWIQIQFVKFTLCYFF